MEKLIDLLQKIVDNVSRAHSYSLLLSSNKSDFTTQIQPPLEMRGDRWAVGLLCLETYNSIPNITDKKIMYLDIQQIQEQLGRKLLWLLEVTKSTR